ncbi:MAG: VRR-NUC domain-containing protein [Halieaceae bacterium]
MVPEPATVQLQPRYYLHNFEKLCSLVLSQYHDVLTDEEHEFLDCFAKLDIDAQCLYLRLVSRVGPWFRLSTLAYEEIGAAEPAAQALVAAGLAIWADELTVDELQGLFTRPELADLFREQLAGAVVRTRKAALAEQIAELAMSPAALCELVSEATSERFIAPLGGEVLALLELLFFGNRRQGLTDFLLSDLGVANYFPYTLGTGQRFFVSRAAVEEYLLCGELADQHYQWQETREPASLRVLAEQLLAQPFEHVSSARRWQRLCNRIARDLERTGDLNLALALYSRSQLHPARERSARVLEAQAQWPSAIEVCEEILVDAWCEDEQAAAQRMLPRLQRKAGCVATPRPRDQFAERQLLVNKVSGSVERDTAAVLTSDWSQVRYVENKLMCSLFGLAFWEEIFAAIPGAFHNPYQSVPTDMYEQGFSQRRQDNLAQRLQHLSGVDLPAELGSAYRKYRDYQCRWTHWRALDEELVETAARIIPTDHLLSIWQRMLFDPGENRRGFPDLIAFGEQPGDYQMIEVKGPGDSLQESQKRWLRFFATNSIPASVAQVRWADG